MDCQTKVISVTTTSIDLDPEEVVEAVIAFAKAKYPDLTWDAAVNAHISANDEGELLGGSITLTKTN
jgi:hypothetical protein